MKRASFVSIYSLKNGSLFVLTSAFNKQINKIWIERCQLWKYPASALLFCFKSQIPNENNTNK